MSAVPSQFSGSTLWLLAFAAVAALIGFETDWGRAMTREPPKAPLPPPQPVEIALLPEFRLEGGIAARRETVERPAFIPTRRPAPAAVQEAAKPRMQKGQFTLTGTAVVDQKAIAFLRENAGGKARSVRSGETINGLTVVEIGRDRVKLAAGDESEELVLKVAAGPRVTIQPPQPGAPGVAGVPPGVSRPSSTPPAPGTPAGAPIAGQPAPMDSDQSILERRRAARAAQAAEAARAASAQSDSNQGAAPQGAVPAAAPQPQPQPQSAAPATQPDPAWAEVYRRMQQPRR